MTAEKDQDEGGLRAKLEFSVARKSFEKAHMAWSNAPAELKPALLLTGAQLARAEAWLVDFSDKLSDSEKRFILKSKTTRPSHKAHHVGPRAKGFLSTFISTPVLWSMAIVLFVVARNYLPKIAERAVERSNAEFAAAKGVRQPGAKTQSGHEVAARGGETPATGEARQSPRMAAPPRSAIESLDQPSRKWLHAARAMTADEKVARLVDMAIRRSDMGEERASMLIALEAIQTGIDAAGPGKQPAGIAAASSIFMRRMERAQGSVAAPSEAALVPALFCSAAHRVIVASGADRLEAWRTAPPALSLAITDRPNLFEGASLDAACSRIATTGDEHTAEIRSLLTGERIAELAGHEAPVLASAFSPDGRVLATASEDRTIRLWNAASGRLSAVLAGHDAAVMAVAYSPDGSRLATGSADMTVRIWDAATGSQLSVLSGHAGSVTSVAFTPDGGRLLTTSTDGTAAVWETASGRRLALLHGDGSIVAAVMGADASLAATASDLGQVRIWDLATAKVEATIPGRGEPARKILLSQDGRTLLVLYWGGDAVLWNVEHGVEIARLNARGQHVVAAEFAPDGQAVTGLLANGAMLAWPVLATPEALLQQARGMVPGCLSREERDTLGLGALPPRWCSETAQSRNEPEAQDRPARGAPAAFPAD